jgi:sensor domain CHASE-containing protein
MRLAARLGASFGRHWKGIVTGVTAAGAAVVLYVGIEAHQASTLYQIVEGEAARLQSEMIQQIRTRSLAIRDLARRWEAREPVRREWESDVDSLVRLDLQFRAVLWVEPSLEARWVAPGGVRLRRAVLDSTHDAIRLSELRALLSGGDGAISRSFTLPEAPRQLLMCAPLHRGEQVTGYLVGVLRANDVIDALVRGVVQRGYAVAITEASRQVFGPVWLESGDESMWSNETRVSVSDLGWDLNVWPSREHVRELRSIAPTLALALGLVVAVLLGGAVDRWEFWKRRALGAPILAAEPAPAAPEPEGGEELVLEAQDETPGPI